jgi:hypothetical protein
MAEHKKPFKVLEFLEKRWFSLLITITGVGGVVYYLVKYAGELKRLEQLSFWQIIVLSVLVLVLQGTSALTMFFTVRLFDVKMGYFDALSINSSSSLINVIPMGALSFRAVYLKKIHDVRLLNYGLTVFVTLVLVYIIGGILGIIGALLLPSKNGEFILLLAGFAAYILVSLLAVCAFKWLRDRKVKRGTEFRLPFKGKLGEVVRSVIDGFDTLAAHPKAIAGMFLSGTTSQILQSFKVGLIGQWLGYPIGFSGGLVLNSITLFVSALPIPNNTLGLKELFTGFGANILGLGTAGGVIIASVDRVMTLAWSIFIGGICLLLVRRKIAAAEKQDAASGE